MKVVILCGGYGTRIRDVADNVPKPMIPIGRYPILWHIMKYYASYGFKEFVLCLGYKSQVIKDFFLNYEANIGVTLDTSKNAKDFQKQVADYWNSLLNDENTKKCDLPLLDKLLEYGSVVDERKQKPFKEIIQKISDLPFKTKKKVGTLPPTSTQVVTTVPALKENFAMTLSGFDVSAKSQDPVILIPIAALKSMPFFWNWPILYTDSGAGYPQLYAIANIRIDGKTLKDQHIRIYYYDKKKEFRLQCEPIKRNGNQGDIVTIHSNPNKPL